MLDNILQNWNFPSFLIRLLSSFFFSRRWALFILSISRRSHLSDALSLSSSSKMLNKHYFIALKKNTSKN